MYKKPANNSWRKYSLTFQPHKNIRRCEYEWNTVDGFSFRGFIAWRFS